MIGHLQFYAELSCAEPRMEDRREKGLSVCEKGLTAVVGSVSHVMPFGS